ncbi:hypothetical protein A2Y85_01065 [candidate division WOR-3 bacterium RBG_13_43_14]|uniref:Uncharacterized protein n=1 Tax=candidate division WOR-3 bacterium RBG_13_43_14 TaxID=1802590 RepID=A0A1F4UAJ4_UNCW3|nr:MAG: hypothetical protein A2Y85_01065 [candidate division WOR-3 bacterium RBG_13_43_14]
MKYVTALFCVMTLVLCIGCSQTKTIVIDLSNNQSIAVAYDGYYTLNGGAQEAMTGTTPNNYEFDLSKGDILQGIVYKSDSSNFTDTLVFKIFIDDVEQTSFTRNIIIPTELGGIGFQLTVQ